MRVGVWDGRFARRGGPLLGVLDDDDDRAADSRVSAIIQTASEGETLAPKTFQLIRQSRSGSGEGKSDGKNNSDRGATANHDNDEGVNGCGDQGDPPAAADRNCDNAGVEGVNGLDRQDGGAEAQRVGSVGHGGRRRTSSSDCHGDEGEGGRSGAPVISEQSLGDSHRGNDSDDEDVIPPGSASPAQSCSVSDALVLDAHAPQVTEVDSVEC